MSGRIQGQEQQSYQYDLNIQCKTAHMSGAGVCEEAEEIASAVKHHLGTVYSLQCRVPGDAVLGSTVLGSGFDAMQHSRYTALIVTRADWQGDAWQTYWRQSTLCVYMTQHPRPHGQERILPILHGVSEEEFKEANREFSNYICLTIPDNYREDTEWLQRLGGAVQAKELFKCVRLADSPHEIVAQEETGDDKGIYYIGDPPLARSAENRKTSPEGGDTPLKTLVVDTDQIINACADDTQPDEESEDGSNEDFVDGDASQEALDVLDEAGVDEEPDQVLHSIDSVQPINSQRSVNEVTRAAPDVDTPFPQQGDQPRNDSSTSSLSLTIHDGYNADNCNGLELTSTRESDSQPGSLLVIRSLFLEWYKSWHLG